MTKQDEKIKQEILKEIKRIANFQTGVDNDEWIISQMGELIGKLNKDEVEVISKHNNLLEDITIQKTRDDDLKDLKKAKIIVWQSGEMHITKEGLEWLKKRDNQAIKEVFDEIGYDISWLDNDDCALTIGGLKDMWKKFGVEKEQDMPTLKAAKLQSGFTCSSKNSRVRRGKPPLGVKP